jgi:hypothetical protein
MPAPCPGCIGGFGGGSGTDGGGNSIFHHINRGSSGGTGGGGGDDGRQCIVYYPDECKLDSSPDSCIELCCRYDDQPSWLNSCCSENNEVLIGTKYCQYTSEGDCACKCCWAEEDENSPEIVKDSFGQIYAGSPPIGSSGDQGVPWNIIPLPAIAPDYLKPFFILDMSFSTQRSSNKPLIMSSIEPVPGFNIPSGLKALGLNAVEWWVIPQFCENLKNLTKNCLALECICSFCLSYTNSRNKNWPYIFIGIGLGVLIALLAPPISIWTIIAGGAFGWYAGSSVVFARNLLDGLIGLLECLDKYISWV